MAIDLLPRQRAAVAWLHEHQGRGLLWMDAGTGKTFAALQYLLDVARKGRVLVLCPSVLKKQWASEAKLYCGANANIIDGSRSERVDQWKENRWLSVANYELLDRDFDVISQITWLAVVADESQMLKSPASKRWKLFRHGTKQCRPLDPPYRLALSGTPLPNALWEIWTTLDWIRPGILGSSFWSFRSTYCVTNPFIPGAIVGYRDEDRIRSAVAANSFRSVRDPRDRPALTSRLLPVTLSPEEQALYEQLRKECRLVLGGVETLTVPNILAQILRLRQLVDCPAVLGASAAGSKLAALDAPLARRGAPPHPLT